MIDFIQQLSRNLQSPLPGRKAQYKMAHAVRQDTPLPPPNAREAGVLALFYPKAKDWHLALILRPNKNPNDRHGGQVSFPGGKREESDENLQATALRETEEEVGVDRRDVEVLGALTDLYIPVSNFLVAPYVGFLDYEPVFNPQPEEVEQVLEIPFSAFMDAQNHQLKDLRINSQMTLKKVPYFAVQQQTVWGATAMMISELLEVWEQ
ncbi:MAG: NUDIX hydrolase [Lewinella sp.]|uniref:NUDIX hydrolase n=1 Tax=Lewinella sp. TaxID=2004506 RepID=UPI003D6B56C8